MVETEYETNETSHLDQGKFHIPRALSLSLSLSLSVNEQNLF
jgi:hypothetical protein